MKKDIILKLNGVLSRRNYDEVIVTYVFVEVRKILEKNDLYNEFPLISFYSDWVVHSYLDRTGAKEYLKKVETIFNGDRNHDVEVDVAENIKPLIQFKNLKLELNNFFKKLSLESAYFENNWRSFLNNLIEIIADTPLRLRGKSLIDSFIFKPQYLRDDVIFEIKLRSGINHSVISNFNFLDL